jgi:hypothetical protein
MNEDMNEDTHTTPVSPTDILAQLEAADPTKIETSYPILATGTVNAIVSSVTADAKDGKGFLTIKYTLAQPWHSQPIDGSEAKQIQVGFPFNERIYFNDWEDPQSHEIKNFGMVRLAQFREAIFGKAKEGDSLMPLEQYINQPITLNLKFEPAPKNKKSGEVYSPKTTIAGYVRRKV